MSTSDILDSDPQLLVRYAAPRRPGSGIPTQIVDLPQRIMNISKEMVRLSLEIVEFPGLITELSGQLMDLSQKITNLNSQLFPHLDTLSQGLPAFPLQSPAQLIADPLPVFPIVLNASPDTSLDEPAHGSQLILANPPAYYPLESAYISPKPNRELLLSRQLVTQFSPLAAPYEPSHFISSPLLPPPPPPPMFFQSEIPLPITTLRFYEYGDCSETLPLTVMKGVLRETGSEEIRSIAAFVNKIKAPEFIPEDEHIQEVRLKNPCLNCLDLMERMPETVKMLAATGWSDGISWISGNRQTKASEIQRRVAYGVFSFREFNVPSTHYDFLISVAYEATQEEIYIILEAYTVANVSPFVSAEQKKYLSELWEEFIVPFRQKGTIFRLNQENNVDPVMVTLNDTEIPICTIFCALAYILSLVLSPQQVEAQRKLSYLPLMAVLARWCYVLCPWAYPVVVSVAYSTSSAPDIYFLLGTSKPSTIAGVDLGPSHSINMKQMRGFRRILLDKHFGMLQHPCPVRVAAESGSLAFD